MLSSNNDLSFVNTGKKNRVQEDIRKPKIIVDYNNAKQGIDISDQMASYFSPLRKTIKWYHKVAFEYLLNTSVVNALIIYKEFRDKTMQISDFRESIILSLCKTENIATPGTSKPKHTLEETTEKDHRNRKVRKRCSKCYERIQKTLGRQEAMKQTKKVTTFCGTCEAKPSLCRKCFFDAH
ncbi:UNVERIFIED_CONTAM: hypothetical protein RMT77_000453 [Armadillidium vulgare]